MSIFNFAKKLFARSKDPTKDWPESTITALSPIDVNNFKIGEFRFGDDVEKCRFLGKCSRYEPNGEHYFKLYYDRLGLQIEFEKGKFCFFDFIPGEQKMLQILPDLRLIPETTVEDIKRTLGPPREEEIDEDEIVLYYSIAGNELEFELTLDGRLEQFHMYLDG